MEGHCFVMISVSFPVLYKNSIKYIRAPLKLKMWVKGEQTKLEIAAELLRLAVRHIGTDRKILVCCDSWYPKGEVLKLQHIENVEFICAVRTDTALYKIPDEPARKGPGRRRIYGERVSLENFTLIDCSDGMRAGVMTVRTNLFRKTLVRAVKTVFSNGSKRLFLCTAPEEWLDDVDINIFSGDSRRWMEADAALTPLSLYSLRWDIETSFYEMKKFWGLCSRLLRSRAGIERILNLQAMVYSLPAVLPFTDSTFAGMAEYSIQERRFLIGRILQQEMFFTRLTGQPETDENSRPLIRKLELLLQETLQRAA